MSAQPAPPPHRRLLDAGALRRHLRRSVLRLLGYAVLAVLVLKLAPGLEEAVESLGHVSWAWVAGAVALETISELGYVLSWHAIVDPENLLSKAGGQSMARRLAWAQLAGGTLVPAGSFGTLGVGAWFLSRIGMPTERIAERLLSLSLLNTAVDALTLVIFGVLLGTGLLAGTSDPLLTLLPAGVAAVCLLAALVLARRLARHAERLGHVHRTREQALRAVAQAVLDVDRYIFHGERLKSLVGAIVYLGFDLLVLWTAFLGIHAHPVPHLSVVVMAYIIGALGGSLPFLPAGVGAVGGIAATLVLYGVRRDPAVAAVVVYQAVALLVPLVGGTFAFLRVRGHLKPIAGELRT
jgi:uncharacterized membrane protein YbhN (UPF0104 family)